MASHAEIDELGAVLEQMLGTIRGVEPLASGSGGRSFLAVAAHGTYVAKVFRPDSPVLLGPEAQFALLEALLPIGIAPAPVGVDAAAGVLVTEYVAGATQVSAVELRDSSRILAIAAVLRRLHAAQAPIDPFTPVVYAGRYLRALGGIDALSPPDRKRYLELLELAAEFETRLETAPRTICHNDLAADNLLFRGEPILIDFDFAAVATPILDLASVAVMNGFAASEISLLLSSYFDGRVPFGTGEFARVERLQRLLAHFWSLATAGSGAAIVAQYRIADD